MLHFLPLAATALGEPWPPQQSDSISLCLSSSPSTALSSLISDLLPRHYEARFPNSFHRHLFLILPRLIVKFRNKLLLLCGVFSPTPNPQPGGPGYPFSSGSSPLTCLAREALQVAYATASIALGFMSPRKPLHYVKVGIYVAFINTNLRS